MGGWRSVMSFFERGLLFIYSLFTLFLSALFIFFIFGWTTPIVTLGQLMHDPNQSKILLILFGLLVFLSIWFLLASFRSKPKDISALVQDTDLGQVRISILALENIVNRVVAQIKGVREVKPKLFKTEEGIGVYVEVLVVPDLNIPSMTKDIQFTVQDYLDRVVGLNIKDVRVYINNISVEAKARVE
jgi:uncharacterized alkaline shock family protein YloU